MSLIVKGMEMPKECQTCPMSHYVFSGSETILACYELHKYVSDEEGCRDEECPLVEVPTPHGSLTDADYLKEHIIACATNGRPLHKMELSELLEAIDDVPTVIEAEL